MHILIACHIKNKHPVLHVSYDFRHENMEIPDDKRGMMSLKNEFGINQIDYIDTSSESHRLPCGFQYNNWNDIPDETYDAIYLICAPVYSIFYYDTYIQFKKRHQHGMHIDNPWHIFKKCFEKLKPNGYINIPHSVDEYNRMSASLISNGNSSDHDIAQKHIIDVLKMNYQRCADTKHITDFFHKYCDDIQVSHKIEICNIHTHNIPYYIMSKKDIDRCKEDISNYGAIVMYKI